MTHVATLISSPGTHAIDPTVLNTASRLLPHAGPPQDLDPATAVDIPFTPAAGATLRALADSLRDALAPRPIDVVVQPVANRRKALLLADMDSTMIGQECIDELADFVGLKTKVAAITEAAMRGDLPFEAALRERVALLKNLPIATVETVLAERIHVTPGARALVMTMRANGAYACLVSGGFHVFTGPVAKMIGFNEDRSNRLLTDDKACFAGTVAEPIFGRDNKQATLVELTRRFKLRPSQTMAVGDGANDLAMIAAAGLGVAYHAKPKVRAAAAVQIDYCDLTALLYAQGYRRAEFAAA
jgi:phosphoserine phosphatase